MDNLVEQLRARAQALPLRDWTILLLIQAADTIAAQARLLELAGTLAGAVIAGAERFEGYVDTAPIMSQNREIAARMRKSFEAFTAAQAEYRATGTVPCPECEEKGQALMALAVERDDLRRQLAEAQADNAALVEALGRAVGYIPENIRSLRDGDVPLKNVLTDIFSQPHHGAPLLGELAALRRVIDALSGHDYGHLSRWVTTLKQSDGEGWAIGEMVQLYLDAIRNRKDDR